jgi:general secretion pathway protein D
MTFQVVNEFFRARMQMLEEKNRVVVLATPLLLTANNEVSRLFVGEERPIVRNIASQTILTENNVATAPNTTIEFRSVGTTLLITPNINSDRTVTLRLLQENSAINAGGATIPVVLSGGNLQNVSVDVVSARSISGTFVAKDGLSVAVGGLIEEQKSDARAQVPLLGRIPLLGLLFRRQETGATRRELVILIRPHVISTPSEGEAISRNLLRDLSVHPSLPDARGTLGTFGGREEGRVP